LIWDNMKILVVSPHFPFPPRAGVNVRTYNLLRQLAARHDVTLLSYAGPGDQDGVEVLGRYLRVVTVERPESARAARRLRQLRSVVTFQSFWVPELCSTTLQDAVDDLCATLPFDLVQLEASVLCALEIPPGMRVVLDAHNIEYELLRRMAAGERSLARRAFNTFEYGRYRRFEERSWTDVDGCVLTSGREERIVRAAAPETLTAVVPNGVDLEFFRRSNATVEPRTVVFNGTLGYRPNVDAAHHLVDDIWPLVLAQEPDARLIIVGSAPEAERRRLARPSVILTGEVPDIRSYLRRAAVVVVPVRMGGGTRLKVLEGLAMEKAVVSTSVGCEGIATRDGVHLLIADDAPSFALRMSQLFADSALRERLGKAGRSLIEAEYSWDLAGCRLEALYQRVAAERPGHTTSKVNGKIRAESEWAVAEAAARSSSVSRVRETAGTDSPQ
jgi:polysaccharide biosynthesis protein PslH